MNRNMMNRNAGIASFIPQRMNEGGDPSVGERVFSSLKDFGSALAQAPRGILKDLRMGFGIDKPDQDFLNRTKSTMERNKEARKLATRASSEGAGAQLNEAIMQAGLGIKQFNNMTEAQKNFVMMTNPGLKQAFSRHHKSAGHNFEVMPSGFGSGDTGGGDGGDGNNGDGDGVGTQIGDFNFFGGYAPVQRSEVEVPSTFQNRNIHIPDSRLDPIFPKRPPFYYIDPMLPVRPDDDFGYTRPYFPGRGNFKPFPMPTIPGFENNPNYRGDGTNFGMVLPDQPPVPQQAQGIASLFGNEQAPRYMFEGIMG